MLITLALFASINIGITETITFHEVAGETLMMDVYRPAESTAKAPCVIVIHGGAWTSGDRSDMRELSEGIALNGMVAFSIDYRLAPTHKWPSMLEDSQAALTYIMKNADELGVDMTRIGVAGASAGGHLALLLGLMDETNKDIDAVLNLFGPTDLSQDYPLFLAVQFSKMLMDKDLVDAAEDIKLFSPVTYVSNGDTPVFTIHGLDDPLVPPIQSERLDTALKSADVHHTLRFIEGMKHGIDQSRPEEMKAISDGVAFLSERLK